jgi:hypothetical protein
MNYTGAASDSDIGRFAAFHQTANFRNQSHIWEWTWRWPSSGNIGGWAPDWVTGEGLTFAQLEPGGGGVVGHHLFLDAGPPFRVRFGRHKFEAFSGWEYAIGPAFPADTYVHNRIEIKWTANTDGYIRVYTDSGSGFTKWVDFTGVTMPNGWDCWTVYQNVRKPATWGYTNTLEWINHRLTIV